MNLPNRLTISRIFLTLVFMLLAVPLPIKLSDSGAFSWATGAISSYNGFVLGNGRYLAGIVFLIAFATDAVDGYIARKHNMITDFGKFLDPLADKLLVTAALVVLVERGNTSGWVAVIIISREFMVTGLRLIAISSSGKIIAAGALGKLKTVAQFIALALALFDNFPLSLVSSIPASDIFMFLAVVLTVVSGIEYIVKNKSVFNGQK